MGKYDKFFPQMSNQKREELRDAIKMEYNKVRKQNASDARGTYEAQQEIIKWMRLGIDVRDTFMVGPFTVNEMLGLIKLDISSSNDRAAIIKAMDNCMGVTKIELKENDNGRYSVKDSDKASRDREALEKKDVKYSLTRWDKFWGFFGIKTDHARAVETSIASVEAYKEQQQQLNKKVVVKQLKQDASDIIKKTKDASNHIKERCNLAKGKFAGWNSIFFDEKKPNDYPLKNGKKVAALSLCMAIMHQRGNYDFSEMSPQKFAQIMENDKQLQKEVKELGTKISNMVVAKETAIEVSNKLKYTKDMLGDEKDITKEYDDEIKALLKPENPRNFRLSDTTKYYMMGKNADAEKKQLFSNYCISIKIMDDMAKIFGKEDNIYCYKNAIDQAVEKQIKDTLTTMQVYDAIVKEDYDTALKQSPIGKNDYENLEDVMKQCVRDIKKIEVEYNKTSPLADMNPTKSKVQQNKEPEIKSDEMGLIL